MPDANRSCDVGTAIGSGAVGPLRVLLVDDSAWLRHSLRAALEQAGLIVVGEAADGAQALTQAAIHHPDLVLMDLRMPGMDGIHATQALHQQQPATPVVLWTGADDAQLASAVRQAGAQAGLPKGVGTAELIATLHATHAQARACPLPGPR